MRISFFLPTNDEWHGTYKADRECCVEGINYNERISFNGFVECVISNELSPAYDQIRIGFWGNDDFALIKDSDKKDPARASEDLFEALCLVNSIPRPVSKEYLRSIGFEPF